MRISGSSSDLKREGLADAGVLTGARALQEKEQRLGAAQQVRIAREQLRAAPCNLPFG